MSMNPLPPQAYTKDTMLKAYQWLQAQPSNIREMALTPDILVSLYLKASRDGEQSLDRPSIQNFKAELKNLAGLMGELDGPPSLAAEAMPKPRPSQAPPPPEAPPAFIAPPSAPPPQAPPHASPSTVFIPPPTPSVESPFPTPAPAGTISTAPTAAVSGLGVDPRSFEMLKEIKEDFNLSCEREALRMLIKIGFTKAKSLLKDH
ncbi:MAG: hypothetical protein KF802_07020 [Bdellovibrionaceae bacterium]|nr:hypothetical protein [Pseudobdellovibrionaceae bacterium]